MIQYYLVTGIYRPVGGTVTTEHITRLVYYDPLKKKNVEIPINDAIGKIEKNEVIYFIYENGLTINLQISIGTKGKFLRTNGDKSQRDCLLDMHRY